MFQIFKWELLASVELAVQPMPSFHKAKKYSFLDIEINPMAFINRWRKSEEKYIFPQKNLHVITEKIKWEIGQSSTAKASSKVESSTTTTSAKGKEKSSDEEKETLFVDIYQDAQDLEEHDWET